MVLKSGYKNAYLLLQNRNSSFNNMEIQLEAVSKIADHVQEQGVSRRKSAAYNGEVCEHFKEAHNEAIGR
jgi:hypothetical protein